MFANIPKIEAVEKKGFIGESLSSVGAESDFDPNLFEKDQVDGKYAQDAYPP